MNQGAWPFLIKLSQMGLVTKMKKEKEIRRFRSFFQGGVDLSIKLLKPPHVILPSAERGRN